MQKFYRPQPPAIEHDAMTGRFSGEAQPGTNVRLTTSVDEVERMTASDEQGRWRISIGGPPTPYTRFFISVSDPASGAESEQICFTFAGNQPRLENLYACPDAASGVSQPGAEITVYGPDGAVFGRCFVFDRHGTWAIKFRNRVGARADLHRRKMYERQLCCAAIRRGTAFRS
nr:carboxypeptidase-like regulatory domain-containing protein [Marinicella sp. W31]MDC2879875.1 hypothetical protein [Marinicella sp. W31]